MENNTENGENRWATNLDVVMEWRGGVGNDIYTLNGLVETVWRDDVLDDGVLELGLVLRKHGDPLFSLRFRPAGTANGVSCFEIGKGDAGADEAVKT